MEVFSGLTVRQLMVPEPVVVPPQQTVQEVVQLMNERRIGAILISENNHVVGIFTERDLLHHSGQQAAGWRQRPIADWMTKNPITIGLHVGWEEATALMERLHVRHLPVVDDGHIVGILTARDLMGRRGEHLNRLVEERTRELRLANERLQERDAELRLHMTVAGRLQERLLPEAPPAWCEIGWGFHYEPLDALGGDYYDFAQPDEEHLGILISDASGHSIPAAMVAIMARTAFANSSRRTFKPSAVLAAMNKLMHGLTDEHFVTAFYGVFERSTRLFTYANAGHPFPLRLSARDGRCRPVEAHGLMLGIMSETAYEEYTLQLEKGDKLLFYTDGVVECIGENHEAFGQQRLEAYFTEWADQSPTSIAQRLADRLRAYRGGGPAGDDITILAAEIVA